MLLLGNKLYSILYLFDLNISLFRMSFCVLQGNCIGKRMLGAWCFINTLLFVKILKSVFFTLFAFIRVLSAKIVHERGIQLSCARIVVFASDTLYT